MSIALYPALIFTVALLVTTAYFLMGGLPLLVLDHGTALDARFIHGFFNLCYKAAFVTALGASISFAGLGNVGFALGAAALAGTGVVLRRQLIPAMAQWGAQIQTSASSAIRTFRQVHALALRINLLQLMLLVWALTQFSLSARSRAVLDSGHTRRHPMRGLPVALLIAALAPDAGACSCFSLEMRTQTGRETLALAQLAVFGRVVGTASDGSATLMVLESFKGPPKGSTITVAPGAGQCTTPPPLPDQEVLLIAFHEPVTACGKYDKDHFLLEVFRANAGK